MKMFDSLTKLFEDKNLNQKMALRKQLKNVKIQNAEQLEAVEEEVENTKVVITILNGLPGLRDSFIQCVPEGSDYFQKDSGKSTHKKNLDS